MISISWRVGQEFVTYQYLLGSQRFVTVCDGEGGGSKKPKFSVIWTTAIGEVVMLLSL